MTPEEKRQSDRERYAWYREHGICVKCGKQEAVPGMVQCGECLYKRAMRYDPKATRDQHVRRLEERRAAGRCTKCGGEPRPGFVTCERCAAQSRASVRRWKNNNRVSVVPDATVCRLKGCCEPVVPGKTLCKEHLERYRAIAIQNLEKANGQDHPWRKMRL